MYVGEKVGNITLGLSDEKEQKLRRLAKERYSGKKGSLAKTMGDAIDVLDFQSEREQAKQRILMRIKKGYRLGKILIKNRSEIYDRFDRTRN